MIDNIWHAGFINVKGLMFQNFSFNSVSVCKLTMWLLCVIKIMPLEYWNFNVQTPMDVPFSFIAHFSTLWNKFLGYILLKKWQYVCLIQFALQNIGPAFKLWGWLWLKTNCLFLISNFCRVLYVVCFLLGNSPAPEFYMPTFWNTLSVPSS
jgi:hypothetical protein